MTINAHRSGEKDSPSSGTKNAAAWLAEKRVFHWLGFCLCLLAIVYLVTERMPTAVISYGDSVQYWAAGRLFLLGENPYSPDLVLSMRAEVGGYTDFSPNAVSMMLYPPWVVPFLLPFGALDYAHSRLLWFSVHLAIIFFSSRFFWQLYHGEKRYHWAAYAIAFTFAPTLLGLLIGHITPFHLLGLAGFLYFVSRPARKTWSDLAAGACAALVTFKPQLLFLFMAALLLWAIQQRRWPVLAGGGIFLLAASGLAILIDPAIFAQFWQTLIAYDVGAWLSPALGTALRLALGYRREWLQLVPPMLGLLWLGYYWIRQRHAWDWFEQMPLIVLASFLTSAYMWSSDMVLLLLPILQVSIAMIKSGARGLIVGMFAIYLAINALVIYQFITINNDYYFVWLVPALLGWWLLGNRLARPALKIQYSQP